MAGQSKSDKMVAWITLIRECTRRAFVSSKPESIFDKVSHNWIPSLRMGYYSNQITESDYSHNQWLEQRRLINLLFPGLSDALVGKAS